MPADLAGQDAQRLCRKPLHEAAARLPECWPPQCSHTCPAPRHLLADPREHHRMHTARQDASTTRRPDKTPTRRRRHKFGGAGGKTRTECIRKLGWSLVYFCKQRPRAAMAHALLGHTGGTWRSVARGARCVETPCEVVQCEKRPRTGLATCPSAGCQVRLRRARFDSQGCQVDGRLRPRVEGAG